MYKSRIILSSLTTLGLVGAGYVATNHMNLVSAESGSNAKVETIASKIDAPKKVETAKPATVHAEEVKPLNVNTELVEKAVVNTESIETVEESHLVAEEASNTDVQSVVESTQEAPATENVTSTQETTSNEVVTPVDEGIKDEVIYDSRNDVKPVEESTVNEIINIQDVPEVEHVSRETVTEETQSEAETPATESVTEEVISETKVDEEVQPAAEEVKTEETPKVEEVKEEAPKAEEAAPQPAVATPAEQPKVEKTKVETPKVEAPVAPKALKNPINDKTNTYPIGQCTWGVKSLADWVGNYWGNANQWGDSARKAGYTTGSTPQVGSVVVFPNVMYEGINYGHVAYVTHVYDDGSIEVMEANYGGNQSIGNYRGKFNPNDARHGGGVYYIYPNA